MKHIAIALVVLAGLAIALGLVTTRVRDQGGGHALPLVEPESDLREKLARLESEFARNRERLARLEAKQLETPDQTPEPSPPPADSPNSLAREERVQIYVDRMAAAATEARDELWAKGMETDIKSAIEKSVSLGAKYSIDNLSCRTSICTFEISHENREDLASFQMSFPHRLPHSDVREIYSRMGPQTADGKNPVAYAVFRSGYPLPGENISPPK
jgi:hypothetical protein